MLNAVERTVGSYEEEQAKTTRDLEIAQGQLRDYEARLGGTFGHEAYLQELTSLRDSLEAALSSTTQAFDTESIVANLNALKAAHTVEAAPERTARKAAGIEEAVTTRILRGREAEPVKAEQPTQIEIPVHSAEIMRFRKPVVNKPKATHWEKAAAEKRQLSLF
jgi:hypothetical protein